jgi:hypothetical protein
VSNTLVRIAHTLGWLLFSEHLHERLRGFLR